MYGDYSVSTSSVKFKPEISSSHESTSNQGQLCLFPSRLQSLNVFIALQFLFSEKLSVIDRCHNNPIGFIINTAIYCC